MKMATAKFNQAGDIENLDELTPGEVAEAYKTKNQEIHAARVAESTKASEEKAKREQIEKDLQAERAKNAAGQNSSKQELEETVKPIKETVEKLETIEKKRQFGYDNNLSPAEVDQVFKINPNPTKETLDDPFVKGGLDAIRNKQKLERNMPGASRSGGTVTNPKPRSEMTAAEKQAEFEERGRGIKERNRR